jgi:pimeloyl-ACP methyl ester carboxylesterase
MEISDKEIRGSKVQYYEGGSGTPLLYLHGIADTHGLIETATEVLETLSQSCRVIAPAHPGCAGSVEDQTLESVEDLVFRTLELIDDFELEKFHLVGNCIGGWLAAEIASRHPEKIEKLALISPSGLQVTGSLTGDLFMAIQPLDGTVIDAREMLFADGASNIAKSVVADQTTEIKEGLMRYQAFRFAARIGFKPPYFYHPKLRERLYRYKGPAMIITGAKNSFVPIDHAQVFVDEFPSGELRLIEGCGHAVHLEDPKVVSSELVKFLSE